MVPPGGGGGAGALLSGKNKDEKPRSHTGWIEQGRYGCEQKRSQLHYLNLFELLLEGAERIAYMVWKERAVKAAAAGVANKPCYGNKACCLKTLVGLKQVKEALSPTTFSHYGTFR